MRNLLIALLAVLCLAAVARSETFSVDCDSPVDSASGTFVVGGVYTEFDPVTGDLDLSRVQCTVVPGTSTPFPPPDGVVCFCPPKAAPTICKAHADVEQAQTVGYCLQSPVDAPDESTSVAALTTNSDEPALEKTRKPRKARKVRK
jgi:hypothetical protein